MLSCRKIGETKPSFTECPFIGLVGREVPLLVGQEIGGGGCFFMWCLTELDNPCLLNRGIDYLLSPRVKEQ